MSSKTLITGFSLVVALSFGALACGCTGQEAASQEGRQAQADEVSWSLATDCGQCHAAEAASQTDSSCLASLHTASECTSCHSNEATLATAHEGATAESKMPKKLKKTSIASEQCLSCHESWEKLASSTADLDVLTDDEGTVINPHDLPAGHVDEKTSCSDCHSMHAAEESATTAQEACISCHHKNVYTCNTCH